MYLHKKLVDELSIKPTTKITPLNLLNSADLEINVLVVDDEQVILEDIVEMINLIADSGVVPKLNIKTAANGADALDIIDDGLQSGEWVVDIIFSDIDMPMLDGKEFCKEIRTSEDFEQIKETPFIFISGKVQDTKKQVEAYNLGADEVYAKPLNREVFPFNVQKAILERAKLKAEKSKSGLFEEVLDFYLNKYVVDRILEKGYLDKNFYDSSMGIIFGDIVGFSSLSQKLTPPETGVLVNGILAVVNDVVEKYDGHYNKSIGDGFLVHFGGPLDNTLSGENDLQTISQRILLCSTELQLAINRFNNLSYFVNDSEVQEDLDKAYQVLQKKLSEKELISIKFRLGAHLGPVNVGNFGPKSNKQYDIVGSIVNMASRLESTAPPGGIRIHQSLYEQLQDDNFLKNYIEKFKESAVGHYQNIKNEDIFQFKLVTAKGFNEKVPTYSIQAIHNLPEIIKDEVDTLITLGIDKIPEVLDYIRLYRGNHYVLSSITDLFKNKNINIRKIELYKILVKLYQLVDPKRYQKLKNNPPTATEIKNLNLADLLALIGDAQDHIETLTLQINNLKANKPETNFDYNQYILENENIFNKRLELIKKRNQYELLVYQQVIPKVFKHIEASLLEYFLKDN